MKSLLLVLFYLTSAFSQSTTSVPPGYCANYLNRYTKENQCIYSFIVPRHDKDDCPSLKSDLDDLKTAVAELQKQQQVASEDRHELREKAADLKYIGKLERDIQMCTSDKDRLQSDNSRLMAEKQRIEETLNQKKIDLIEAESELVELKSEYNPMKMNYSKLMDNYNQLVVNYKEMNSKLNITTESYNKLQAERDHLNHNKHLPSCAVIKMWGYKTSGPAVIDPDGEGGLPPFKVYCDMDSDPSTGITVVDHQYEKETVVGGCNEAGCVSKKVNYTGVTIDQLLHLTNISVACEQYIRYGCYDSKLLKGGTAWWVSGHGQKQTYWGGASPGSEKCACGMQQTCFDANEVCHCDADIESWLYDEGVLRDKSSLPVKELRFGDVDERSGERANFTLGPLKCRWSTDSIFPSCKALREAGVTASGIYLVNRDDDGREVAPFQVRCDFSASESGGTILVNTNRFIFNDCGETGRFGPTQAMCNEAYQETNVRVLVRNGTQSWRTPKPGRYRVTAHGPSGYHSQEANAGRGAVVSGEFEIPTNNEMRILIGQRGLKHAGAGGTFVIKMYRNWTEHLLMVAGAGGSSKSFLANFQVTDASGDVDAKDASTTGTNFGKGGVDGRGGEMGGDNSGPNTSGGGAGFRGNGVASSDQRFRPFPQPALAYKTHLSKEKAPGLGGSYTYNMNNNPTEYHGGFGGGGSASKDAPGGAGGYSGGGGGPNQGHSGGGGSYFNKELASNADIVVNNAGKGSVIIEYLGPLTEVPDEEER